MTIIPEDPPETDFGYDAPPEYEQEDIETLSKMPVTMRRGVFGGEPCIRGHRFPMDQFIGELFDEGYAAVMSNFDSLGNDPTIKRDELLDFICTAIDSYMKAKGGATSNDCGCWGLDCLICSPG